MFLKLYNRVVGWAAKPTAPYYLAFISFIESSFFPIPPFVLLIPMCIANHRRMWFFAGLATAASVLGGLLGYAIGTFAADWVKELFEVCGYLPIYGKIEVWFQKYGAWAIMIAGFSPIPYKIFTISAGIVGMPIVPFFLGSIVSRGIRFYVVAFMAGHSHQRLDRWLKTYVDRVGWWLVLSGVLVWLIFL